MRITVYGTRGSYPVSTRAVARYGGHTTSLFLESGADQIVIDGGSGVVRLGQELVERHPGGARLHVFLTHPHWDHVLGLPFFGPFYASSFEITVHGADSENKTLESVLAAQHKPASFPVSFEHLKSKLDTQRLHHGSVTTLPSTRVRALQLNHPGHNLGYRFEGVHGTFVILTDLAPIEQNHLGAGMAERAEGNARQFEQDYYSALVEFVRGADLVYHDTNFTDEEIQGRVHWGHSTPTHALELLGQLEHPPVLILSHHDPDHDDATLDAIYDDTRKRGLERGIEVLIAKEGGSFQL